MVVCFYHHRSIRLQPPLGICPRFRRQGAGTADNKAGHKGRFHSFMRSQRDREHVARPRHVLDDKLRRNVELEKDILVRMVWPSSAAAANSADCPRNARKTAVHPKAGGPYHGEDRVTGHR